MIVQNVSVEKNVKRPVQFIAKDILRNGLRAKCKIDNKEKEKNNEYTIKRKDT